MNKALRKQLAERCLYVGCERCGAVNVPLRRVKLALDEPIRVMCKDCIVDYVSHETTREVSGHAD